MPHRDGRWEQGGLESSRLAKGEKKEFSIQTASQTRNGLAAVIEQLAIARELEGKRDKSHEAILSEIFDEFCKHSG